jgi:hypothetical protein
MELKYCEHCGGLWVRECGAGVYCNNCQGAVAELSAPKKKPERLVLPVRPRTVVEDYEFEIDVEDLTDFEATGGGMSNVIAWMAAEAERSDIGASAGFPRWTRHMDEEPSAQQFRAPQSPQAQFAAKEGEATQEIVEASSFEQRQREAEDRERERRTYRGRTVAMLRRYMRYSIETGRSPSLLGREFFRAKVTSYTVVTFEDRVIFVHDMEKCLERLDEFSRQLIARHILQEHDQVATGKLLHCTERTIRNYMPVVLDVLSEILIEVGLMKRTESMQRNSCQEGENDQLHASDCEDRKYKV